MSQKQIKENKCRIPEEQLFNRFNDADIDGNGKLSADQITILLQNLGYQDTYKGTIRKICRYLNKEKKLRQAKSETNQESIPHSQNQIDQKDQQAQNSEVAPKQTEQQRKIRKQEQRKKEQDQAEITYEQFRRYFDILQKPVGKILYKLSLQRSVQVAEICKEMNLKNLFHKDRGQRLKINLLVGDQKPSYNSSIQVKLQRQSKKNKNDEVYFVQLAFTSSSQQGAKEILQMIKSLYQMLLEMIVAENQELGQIKQILLIEDSVENNVAKFKISTTDEDLKKFISDFSNTFDEVLSSQVNFVLKILYQFDFMINELKDNPNAMIQDSFVKNANIKIDYSGSRFMNAVKEIALGKNVFQLLKVDNDPLLMALLGFFSMEKADISLKFKNLQRKQTSRDLTQQLIQGAAGLQQMQSETFNLKTLSQLVTGPIIVTAQLQSIKLKVNINIKDILKLPFLMDGQGPSGYESD